MYRRYIKRPLDIVFALALLIALAPVYLITAVVIKLESKGPVIFKQQRFGRNKKPFTVYKFRTMATSAPSNMATNQFTDSASHITRAGKIMRKLSIDELPQLINVIKGDMSMIGPRPVILAETGLIQLRDENGSNDVRPGITGWAQANGRDEIDDVEKAELDGYYVENFGLKMDIHCLLKTVWVIVSVAGHSEGHECAAKNNDKVAAGE